MKKVYQIIQIVHVTEVYLVESDSHVDAIAMLAKYTDDTNGHDKYDNRITYEIGDDPSDLEAYDDDELEEIVISSEDVDTSSLQIIIPWNEFEYYVKS